MNRQSVKKPQEQATGEPLAPYQIPSSEADREMQTPLENRMTAWDIRRRKPGAVYEKSRLSVRVLTLLIPAILLVMAFLIGYLAKQSPGLEIRFDSQGGSPVAALHAVYGETLEPPSDPHYEGKRFLYWSLEEDHGQPFDFTQAIQSNFTLYAQWKDKD